jgi:hypothetical protein
MTFILCIYDLLIDLYLLVKEIHLEIWVQLRKEYLVEFHHHLLKVTITIKMMLVVKVIKH